MAVDYTVNYEDERFQKSDEKFDQRETDLEQTYAGMIGGAENIYQPQIDALDEWGNKQAQLQQERTDLTIQQIEQQKQQAHKDYQKEQSGAYVDWRKQSNQYGTEAEKMASSGLMGTGYSESSQVGMYNTYQNRVAQARESYDRVIMNYNNSINEAKLQNNSALAEIAYNTLTKQLELITEGTMYKNSLILDLADKEMQLQQMRDNDYYKILDQINTENALAEDVRQFDENLKFQTTQAELNRKFEADQAELERQFKEQEAALDRQHDFALLNAKTEKERQLAEEEHKRKKELLAQELANEKAMLKYKYDLENQQNSAKIAATAKANANRSKINTGTAIGGNNTNIKNTEKPVTAKPLVTKAPVDTDSIIALGQGPISGSNLAKQVASGKVGMEVKNGKTTFSYNYASANPFKGGSAIAWNQKKKK